MTRPAARVRPRIALAAASLTIGAAPPSRLVTIAGAAEISGITARTLRNWHKRDPIGARDPITGVFLCDLAMLTAVIRRRFGPGWLPHGLEQTIYHPR
jgi:hypothetical protein